MSNKAPEFNINPDGAVIQWELAPGLYMVQAIGKQTIYEIALQLKQQDKAQLDLQRSVELVRSGDMPRNLRKVN